MYIYILPEILNSNILFNYYLSISALDRENCHTPVEISIVLVFICGDVCCNIDRLSQVSMESINRKIKKLRDWTTRFTVCQ